MQRNVRYISESYHNTESLCRVCESVHRHATIHFMDGNITTCIRCLNRSTFPKYYVYYEGITGYITLYADMEENIKMEYLTDNTGITATNNLRQAKSKHKL